MHKDKELLSIHHLTFHEEGQQKVEESPLGTGTSALLFSPCFGHFGLTLRVEEPGREGWSEGKDTAWEERRSGIITREGRNSLRIARRE